MRIFHYATLGDLLFALVTAIIAALSTSGSAGLSDITFVVVFWLAAVGSAVIRAVEAHR